MTQLATQLVRGDIVSAMSAQYQWHSERRGICEFACLADWASEEHRRQIDRLMDESIGLIGGLQHPPPQFTTRNPQPAAENKTKTTTTMTNSYYADQTLNEFAASWPNFLRLVRFVRAALFCAYLLSPSDLASKSIRLLALEFSSSWPTKYSASLDAYPFSLVVI